MKQKDKRIRPEELHEGIYRFEKHMADDEIYGIVSGAKKLESDSILASLTVGCLKIEAVFYRANEERLPVFEVYVKASADAGEWVCFDSPDDKVGVVDVDFEGNMFELLERVRKDYGLSYTDPDFETLAGKKATQIDKQEKNEGIGMV